MQKIYVTRRFPAPVMQHLANQFEMKFWDSDLSPPRDVLLHEVSEIEGLLCLLTEKIDRELLDAAPELKVVSDCSVGYDNLDLAACAEKGVIATHTPDVLTDTVADTTFALILATGRRIVESDHFVRDGEWKNWTLSLFAGADVHHATLGLLGPGRIARAVARRAAGFDMRILLCGRRPPTADEEIAGAEWVSMDELFSRSDYVSIHVPLTAETRGLVGSRELALMKPTAFLINTARGPVVDESALVDYLQRGAIAGAGLDVFEKEPLPTDHPLNQLANVVLLPHVGSASTATRLAMAQLAARNLSEALAGRRPPAPIRI